MLVVDAAPGSCAGAGPSSSPAGAGDRHRGSCSPVTAVQRRSRCSATSATTGPRRRVPTSCQPRRPRAGCRARVPAVAAEVGEVDATDEGDLVVDHDELLVVAVQQALARVERARGRRCRGRARRGTARTAARLGREGLQRRAGPQQDADVDAAATASARSSRSDGGRLVALQREVRRHRPPRQAHAAPRARIASAIAGRASSPSIEHLERAPVPRRRRLAAQGLPSSGGRSASRRPRRRRRHAWCRAIERSIARPSPRSTVPRGSTPAASRPRRQRPRQSRRGRRAVDCGCAASSSRAMLACMQASGASVHVSPAELAEELLGLWHHLMKGGSKALYALLDELDVTLSRT